VAAFDIQREEEIESAWRFTVQVTGAEGASPATLTFTLSWADYEHWSHGTERPSDVARQVLEFVLAHRPLRDLPDRLDASTVRRWWPEIDRALAPDRHRP